MNYTLQCNGLTFCVDYYVELLGVLCILCDDQPAIHYAGDPVCNEIYVRDVKAFFSNSDEAHLIEMLKLFSKEYYFNYDAPVTLMLMLSNGTTIDKQTLFHERKAIPDELFDRFLSELKHFEHTSSFAAFYSQHLDIYQLLARRFAEDYQHFDSHRYLHAFLQAESNQQYCINLMLGITNANYGATIGNRIYCNICPYHRTRFNEMPDYSFEPIYYSTLVLHEFAHSFINRKVARYRDEIATIDLTPYRQILDELGYGESLETYINETIIRAIECMYVKEHFTQEYEHYISEYYSEGYIRLRKVIDVLQESVDYNRIIRLFS